MHYIILVAKHHDGFCNWPTATTNYSVAATPGQVDIVNRVAGACLRHGVQLGLYYSLWDRHEPRYQDDAAYADFMARQLSELLTRYGSVCELWFDSGWAKWTGTWQETMQRWRWSEIYELVKSLQPSILVLNNTTTEEPGVIRWWPVDARTGEKALPAEKDSAIWSINGQLRYLPMQCEFTMSTSGESQISDGNWFWHPDDHSVAAPEVIVDHLRKANALGANLVLNVGPMASGKLRP